MAEQLQPFKDLFWSSCEELTELLAFKSITTAAYNSHYKHHKLADANATKEEIEKYRKVIIDNSRLLLYPPIIYRTTLIYAVASFEAFLNKLLFLLYEHEPRALKSNLKAMSYEEILSCNSIKSLRGKMINTVLHELSYKSISDQMLFINKKFGFDLIFSDTPSTLFDNNISLPKLTEIFSFRNIILHNSGEVNELFIKNNPNSKYKIGHKIILNHDETHSMVFYLLEMITKLSYQKINLK